MTGTDSTTRQRSLAWVFGWLSISGPVLLLAVVVPWFVGPPFWDAVAVVLEVWCVVSAFIGAAAVVVAVQDLRAPEEDRPRFASAGMVLGLVGSVTVGIGLVMVLLLVLSFGL
jgi:hypothetical protein